MSYFVMPAPAAVARPAAARRAGPEDSLAGRWTLDRGASGDVRQAIDTATGSMIFFVRRIARGRLRSANQVHPHLTVTITPTEVTTQVDGMAPITSPADGRAVPWTRDNGDHFELHTTLAGGRMTQTFVGRDASKRENVFTPAPDGRTLNIAVTVSHPRLPKPVVYKLVYRRD